MTRILLSAAVAAFLVPAAALAQNVPVTGPYVVGRLGSTVDADVKFSNQDRAAPSTFTGNADFKPGFTGELGAGYDFGAFRLEGTVGYANNGVARPSRRARAPARYDDKGRLNALTIGVAGYFDIATGSAITPYVGAGIGASRVGLRLERNDGLAAGGSRIVDRNNKDWGFAWHVDGGVGFAVAPRTTLDVGVRYARTNGLTFDGQTGAFDGPLPAGAVQPVARDFKPRATSLAALVGLRHTF